MAGSARARFCAEYHGRADVVPPGGSLTISERARVVLTAKGGVQNDRSRAIRFA